MSYFLLRFTRKGQPAIERFEDATEALDRLREEEARVRGTEEGVVLLFASDEAELRQTHAHYFESFNALRDAAEDAEEAEESLA